MKSNTIVSLMICTIIGSFCIFAVKMSQYSKDKNKSSLRNSADTCEYSQTPDSKPCINCAIELVCIGSNQYGDIIQFSGKNADGTPVTEIPTTTCDQEGYWSCPASMIAVGQTPVNLPPQSCPALLNTTTSLGWPSYLIVKNKNAFQNLATEACKRGLPADVTAVLDFGLRSTYDWQGGMIDNQYIENWNKDVLHHVISTDQEPQGDLPYNRLVAFGDSITDTANRYVFFPHPFYPEYFYHRYSNGPLWVEYIANKFRHTNNEIELIDVAVAGSAVTPGLGDQYMILMNQIDYALKIFDPNNQPFAEKISTKNTIFSLMAGMIDFRDMIEDLWRSIDSTRPGSSYYVNRLQYCWDTGKFPGYANPNVNEFARQCVSKVLFDNQNSIQAAAVKLIQSGARYFIIPDLPDFTLLPRYNDTYKNSSSKPTVPPAQVKEFIQALSREFKEQLTTQLIPHLTNYGVKIVQLDLYNVYQQLANVDSALAQQAGITYVSAPGQSAPSNINLASVLYWDDVHPSETANCVIAERTYELMYQMVNLTYEPKYTSCYHSYLQRKPGEIIHSVDRKYIR